MAADDTEKYRAKMAALEAEVRQARAAQTAADAARTRHMERPKPPSRELALAEPEPTSLATSDAIQAGLGMVVKQLGPSKPAGPGQKSVLASTGLSLIVGPIGWLYAGAWREAVPAALAWLLAAYVLSFLPSLLLTPLLLVALPASAFVGMLYANAYNRDGKRRRLSGKGKGALPPGPPKR